MAKQVNNSLKQKLITIKIKIEAVNKRNKPQIQA